MFDFFLKGRKLKLGEEKRAPAKDKFPTYELLKEVIILDIRLPEEVERYGELEGAINIPFDKYFASKALMLDKNKKYGVTDLRGIYINQAVDILKRLGFAAVELRGGFFYLTEVMNVKIKE